MKIENILTGPACRARAILDKVGRLPKGEVFTLRELGLPVDNAHRLAELIPENACFIEGVKQNRQWFFGTKNAIANLRKLARQRSLQP